MTVDAHFHVWDPSERDHAWLAGEVALDRAFAVEEYVQVAAANGVEQAVLVQVLNDLDETVEFLALAAAHPTVAGVVGWLDLEAPDVADVVARLREAPGGAHLVAVRHLVQGELDPGFLERSTVLRGLRAVAESGLAFDLLVRAVQLPAAVRAVRAVDGLRVVLDHGGKPPIAAGELEPWASYVGQLAQSPHVVCKVSGLVNEAGPGWTSELVAPYVDHLLRCFGPERLLFGSDWPVCTVVARFDQVVELARVLLDQLGDAERNAFSAGNARRVYGLPMSSTSTGPGPGRPAPIDPPSEPGGRRPWP